MSNQEPLIKMFIQDGTLNDTLYLKLKKEIEEEKKQREQVKQRSKRQHDAEILEKQKFANSFPAKWKYKHVYAAELNECCTKSPLDDMQKFADAMKNGMHRGSFKDPDTALNFLLMAINERINQSSQPFQVKTAIAKAKEELKAGRDGIESDIKAVKELHNETKSMMERMDINAPSKTKPYVT